MNSPSNPQPSLHPQTRSAAPSGDMLQMSVHSLPTPPASGERAQAAWAGRWKMLAVMAVCAAPVVASYFTFYVVKPQTRSNYGALIDPPVPLPAPEALPLRSLQGQAVSVASLKGQWLLITVAGGACNALCERQLYLQRQIREALGKEKDRLDRVWLLDDQHPMRAALAPGMHGATVLRVDPAALRQWLQPAPGQAIEAHWYLVDPRGQWMMRFPSGAEPRKVLKDVTRLLKASAFWDTAGRP